MSCSGKCTITTEVATNPRITSETPSPGCTPEQIEALRLQAFEKIIKDHSKISDNCPREPNCRCKATGRPVEIRSGEIKVVPPQFRVGGPPPACELLIREAFVKVTITETPGICENG